MKPALPLNAPMANRRNVSSGAKSSAVHFTSCQKQKGTTMAQMERKREVCLRGRRTGGLRRRGVPGRWLGRLRVLLRASLWKTHRVYDTGIGVR